MYIGLDIGGSFLKGARVDGAGRVAARLHEPVAKDAAESLLKQIDAAVSSLDGQEARSLAVGIGIPGIVSRGSIVQNCPNLPTINGLPLGQEVKRRTGRPALLENDANAAALAEAWRGAGRDAENVLFVTLGTGIGAGIVLRGRVWSGRSGYAGEIGHIQVEPEGMACGCGSRGCLETIAGAPGWVRRAEAALARRDSSLKDKALDQKTIVDAAREGDAVALEIVNGATRALGVGIAAALDLLNFDRVVVGGGPAAAGSFLLDKIVEETRRRTFAQVFADCTFRLAELGGDAGVVGAARVAMLAMEVG